MTSLFFSALCSAALAAPAVSAEPEVVSDTTVAAADVTDSTHLWTRQAIGVAGWPSGAISDTRVQVRTPLHRSDSIVFQDTFFGAGARIAATPAFSAAGPRVTLAPIDVFSLDVQASYIRYYGGAGIGLLPFDQPRGKLQSQRSDVDSVKADALQVTAAPTFKIKLGPVIAFDAWTIGYTSIAPAQAHSAEFVYEPFNDLVVAWNDITFEHQGAVVAELVPDEGATFLWLGGTARDRFALRSGDRSTTAGLLLRGRPGQGKAVPTITGQALFYVKDADRVGGVPSLALLAEWNLHKAM